MGWIGLLDKTGGRFARSGLASSSAGACDETLSPDDLLATGSLLLETSLSASGRPQTLIGFRRGHPWTSAMSIQALPGGGFVLVTTQDQDVQHTVLPYTPRGRTDTLRLTYSWDAPRRWGQFTLEQPESDFVESVPVPSPRPVPLADLRIALTDQRQSQIDRGVDFVALSDEIEPVGPMPGLTADLPIATPQGYKRAATLQRGSTILSEDLQVIPVLHTASRTVPARGSFRPIRLRAPYFGLRQDILVASEQRLVMRGSKVEYMFGSEAVLVPARHLINGVSAFYADSADLVTYHGIVLPDHEPVIAAGCPLESVYIGRLRRKPERMQTSVLAGHDRSRLPEHPRPVWPVLKAFEAVTLADYRAA